MARGSNTKFRREVQRAYQRYDDVGPYLPCGRCQYRIRNTRGERWIADHQISLGAGGKDDAETNGWPLCELCDNTKTHTEDRPVIDKCRRVTDKHFGVKQSRGWYKPPGYKHTWGRRDD